MNEFNQMASTMPTPTLDFPWYQVGIGAAVIAVIVISLLYRTRPQTAPEPPPVPYPIERQPVRSLRTPAMKGFNGQPLSSRERMVLDARAREHEWRRH